MRFDFLFNLIGKLTMVFFKMVNHGAYSNPGTQVGEKIKDFGAVSQKFFSCLRKTFLLLPAVWQFGCQKGKFGFKIGVDKVRNFKGLCHGWHFHFVCNVNYLSYSLRKLRNILRMKILQLCVKQMYLPNIIWNITNNKNELWKPARLTSLQKTRLQSVSIFFKFVYLFLLLYLLCYPYILSTFCADVFVSLNLVAVSTVWILKNFVTQLF